MEWLNVQLYQYNARMILHFWALHPHLEDDWLEACNTWEVEYSHQFKHIINGHANTAADEGPNSTVDVFRPDVVHDSAVDDPCNLGPDSMCYAVEVCNRFSLLPIDDSQVMTSSAEELFVTEKRRSQVGSDHSYGKLELAAEMMIQARWHYLEISLKNSRRRTKVEDVPVLKYILVIVMAILSCPMVPVVPLLKPITKRLKRSKHCRSNQLHRNLLYQMLQHLQLSPVTSTPL